jgi:negative regulator of flagellin synthesis FlgM
MYIQGTSYLHGAQPMSGPHRSYNQPPAPPAKSAAGADEISISHEADMVSRAREVPDIRADRVARIKAEIASGTYETDAKLDLALSRLLDEIG